MTEPTGTSAPRDQLVGAGAQDRAHRPVEPFEGPAFGEAAGDQAVDLLAARVGAGDDVVEEVAFGLVIGRVLDRRAEPVIVEFLEQAGERRAFHLLLVERLDRGEASGGTRTGTGLGHCAGALAAAWAARKGSSAGGDLFARLPRREMAGVGQANDRQIVDQLVEAVELDRQQRRCPAFPR